MRMVLLSLALLLFSFLSYVFGRFVLADATVAEIVAVETGLAATDAETAPEDETPARVAPVSDALVRTTGDFPEKLKKALLEDYLDENVRRSARSKEICQRTKSAQTLCGAIDPDRTNVLLIGDSFGWDGVNAIATGYPEANMLLNLQGGCPLIRDVTTVTYGFKDCPKKNIQRYKDIESILSEIDVVVISIKTTSERVPGMMDTVTWLSEKGAVIVMLGNPPMFQRQKLPEIIRDHGKLDGLDAYVATKTRDTTGIDAILAAHLESLGQTYIARNEYFCPKAPVCKVLIDGEHPVSMDNTHQSRAAADAFGVYLSKTYPDLLEAP